MRKLLCFTSFLVVIALCGCSTPMQTAFDHPIYHSKPWEQRKVNLTNKHSWRIQGAVSVSTAQKTQMGSFAWQQMRGRYAINIYGPLNLGSIGIHGMPGYVTLYKPTGTFSARTPEALMQQQMGWYLPISNMNFWVRGLPAPGIAAKQSHDQFGHLVFLQQQGWNIQFQAFQPLGNVDLPRKIVMDNQQLHVKLVIKNWNLYE